MQLRTDEVAWRDVEGDIVVLHLSSSQYLRINSSGAVLWRALADGADAQALERLLHEEFGVDPDRAAGDVDAFLSMLRTQQLLQDG